MSTLTDDVRERRVVSSMLWAAWADALGFISELVDEDGLHRRLGGEPLNEPVAWRRRVGGRFGVDAHLPPGCYSDDTQLRLATARAIGSRGFDVEAFARVELTVWPSYALGGGRATRAAAASLTRPSTPWFGNFFDGWLQAGGNGVAMRVQPHVWAAPNPASFGPHLVEVITNGATTHGHPRSLVGAVLHAVALGRTLETGNIPAPDVWPDLLAMVEHSVNLFDDSPELASVWIPSWEKATGESFASAWRNAVKECRDLLTIAGRAIDGRCDSDETRRRNAYSQIVTDLNLTKPSLRGSGTATAVASLALATASGADVAGCARVAAQAIGTDTDTIATMAAALAGARGDSSGPSSVLDADYLKREAQRLAAIGSGKPAETFSYPDLLGWTPPRSQLDAVGMAADKPALAGLGWWMPAVQDGVLEARGTRWLWAQSDFGASFLLKQRSELRTLPDGNWPVRRRPAQETSSSRREREMHPTLFEQEEPAQNSSNVSAKYIGLGERALGPPDAIERVRRPYRRRLDIDEILRWIGSRPLTDRDLGYATRRVAEEGSVEQLIAFTTAIREMINRRASRPPSGGAS